MSSNNLPLCVLQELPNITESISYPLKSSQRIKYTCFNVSKTLIAFGATSGGIYVFNRDPCEFVQLIPSKDGAVTRLAISPDDYHIAFANGRGTVTVTQCDQSHNKTVSSKEHQGNEVTALQWNGTNMVISGDDVGKISVLQLPSFITKTMFQSSSQTIMSLDSRICQLDVKDNMLLVSTLTRCYVCDTLREQYRQIGQKLRDGEYGACFVTTEKLENGTIEPNNQDMIEVKKFQIVDGDEAFAVNEKLANTAIFSSRPSSRLWEASIDGTVKRTHQFKQVLARKPMQVITNECYDKENVCLEKFDNGTEGQSCNFPKIFSISKSAIFSFKKDALYFLDIQDVDNTMWFDTYKDIVDCKLYNDVLYVWLQNGSLICLRFMRIEKYLVKCFLDEKFTLCSELCALFSDYFLSSNNISTKLHILAGLREKIVNDETLERIEDVLEKFDALKANDATQMKSGIYVVDNSYQSQSMLDDANEGSYAQDTKLKQLPTLKDLSLTMTDRLNVSKKMFKEKWEDFEERMKHLGGDKTQVQETNLPTPVILYERPVENEISTEEKVLDNDIVYKESSQKSIELDGDTLETDKLVLERDKLCKSLYQYYRLSLVGKETDETNVLTLIDNFAYDVKEIYKLMLSLVEYCVKIGAIEESKCAPNTIFLNYLNESPKRDLMLDEIIDDEVLYKYFVDSCISVNMKMQNCPNIACECGFPLPYICTNQTPICSEIIDQFIEKQWSSQTKEQCYDICRRMPYLWRKILYLRRNEDLLTILRLLLQILDESILHLFLPQFTIETWDRATQLYAILHANLCLNCNKSFDHMSVKKTLSWDDIGSLMIKSIGGTRAVKLMEKHAQLIGVGELSVKFYHTCILSSLFEKYDAISVGALTDTIYSCYEFEDSRKEICNLLRSTIKGRLKNTSLPVIVAAKSNHWGTSNIFHCITSKNAQEASKNVTLNQVLVELSAYDGNTDCSLCGLPLVNEVLIKDGGLWVFKCGHVFHGACLDLNKLKLCPTCVNV